MEILKLQPILSQSLNVTSSVQTINLGVKEFKSYVTSSDDIQFAMTSSFYLDGNLTASFQNDWAVPYYTSFEVSAGSHNTNLFASYSVQHEFNTPRVISPGSVNTTSLVEWANFIYSSASYYDPPAFGSRLFISSSAPSSTGSFGFFANGNTNAAFPIEQVKFDRVVLNKDDTDLSNGDYFREILSEPNGYYNFDNGGTLEIWVKFISGSDTLPTVNETVTMHNGNDPLSNRNNSRFVLRRNGNGDAIRGSLVDLINFPTTNQYNTAYYSCSLDTWYNFAITYQNTTSGPGNQYDLNLFVNGVLQDTVTASTGWTVFTGTYGNYAPIINCGTDYDNNRAQPQEVGQLRIYNQPLSASVLLSNYNAESNIYN